MTSEEVAVALQQHADRLEGVEIGVKNFRKFQLDMTRKVGFVYGATWFAGIAGLILLAVIGWALSEIVPAAKVVIDDYYHNHPAAAIRQHSKPDPGPPYSPWPPKPRPTPADKPRRPEKDGD